MKVFFEELNKIRSESESVDSAYYEIKHLSKLYNKTMSDQPLSQKDIILLQGFETFDNFECTKNENDIAAADHMRLWCLNGWARHNFFIQKKFSEAEKIIQKLALKCAALYKIKFLRFDDEVKLFPMILALNLMRISYYSHHEELFLEQKKFMLFALLKKNWTENDLFIEELNKSVANNWETIRKSLNEQNTDYFLNKIHGIGKNSNRGYFE